MDGSRSSSGGVRGMLWEGRRCGSDAEARMREPSRMHVDIPHFARCRAQILTQELCTCSIVS